MSSGDDLFLEIVLDWENIPYITEMITVRRPDLILQKETMEAKIYVQTARINSVVTELHSHNPEHCHHEFPYLSHTTDIELNPM